MFKQILLLAAAGLTIAQDSTVTEAATTVTDAIPASSTTATNTSSPVTHTVAVALGGHTFVPDVTLAEAGDVIEFEFYPTNHSVIRAEYGYPCIPYEDTGVDKIGFFSGFKPVDAVLSDPPKWFLTVNDTDPIFFYCGAVGSCINFQMVGVINPNASTSLVTQKQKAKDSTYMLLPGEPFPSEDLDPFSGSASSSSSTSAAPTAAKTSAAAATTSAEASSSHGHGLSAGAIAGIAIGAAAVALAAAVLLYFCGRQSLQNRQPPAQQVSFQPGHGHMSYIDPQKHMSMQSSAVGPALPGYAPSEHSQMHSPHLVPYAPSDALNPGHPYVSPGASPQHSVAVPAYSHHSGSMQSTPHQSMYNPPGAQEPMPGIHEMAAQVPEGQQIQQGGIMGFLRKSSVRASEKGGVERYS